MDFDRARRLAELRRRSAALSAFVAACAGDRERAREAGRLAGQVFAADLADVEAAEEAAETLARWADDLREHPHRPTEPGPEEADLRMRDHLKDVVRDHLPVEFRDWMSEARLSLEFGFRAMSRASDPRIREKAAYIYGRGTMALELGHREAADRELERLRELEDDQRRPSSAV
ncbi:hypothetical protein [Actinomadura macrotermitis]|uniref:Uncharacterized protein n=1 Tax=Actinomadura macrotermitis TaxID=2585200 RepID=A0A7K0BX04_9ACTN|nr:hypothetical protein [Actinomadura macrotermitis]MQY05596.1 hypothetical protein [Actinomadura macrotermitis]